MESLADYLQNQRQQITQSWLHAVQTSPDFTTPDRVPVPQLIDHLPTLLDELVACLRHEESPEAAEPAAREHGRARWDQNFRIDELLRELLLFRRIIMEKIERHFEAASLPKAVAEGLVRRADRFFEATLISSADQFTAQFRSATEKDRQVLAELHQNALSTADQLQAVDAARLRLLRIIAHELRNLLHAASLTAVSLPNEKDPAWRDELHRMLERSHQQMTALVNQLLDIAPLLSGRETTQFSMLELATFTRQLSSNFGRMASSKGLSFHLTLDRNLTTVQTDEAKLLRIVTNLVQNAIKYTDEGGVEVAFLRDGASRFQIRVSDTGPGIPADQQELIFEEFHRVPGTQKREGTGLGLAIVRQLVQVLGGEIRVESAPGEGATFVVTLPDGAE